MRLTLLFLLPLFWISCASDKQEVPIPDVSNIEVDFSIYRYENDLLDIDTNQIKTGFNRLLDQYPGFTNLYFKNIVPINEDNYGEAFYNELDLLLKDNRFRMLVDTIQELYPRFESEIGNNLRNAFKNYKYYFPEFEAPQIYTLVSEFAYQLFLFEEKPGVEGMGIGLDLFMGSQFPYEKIAPGLPSFSEYLTRTFTREHLVRKAIKTILDDRWPMEKNTTLLDHMISNGKKLFVLQRILPETPDSIIIEYSSEQMEWVRDNELQIWSFFFGENLFYETNMLKINKYINASPDSPGMPPTAPGRTGNYIGWQIINAYMQKHPETSIPQLLQIQDAQKIMDESRYRPKPKK